ncbi:MAG: hypothetical protein HPM95_18100 [Alphaproteobacteria bacterium]|nr:hypothetical protein [Alphaproteobacteria bacterium]
MDQLKRSIDEDAALSNVLSENDKRLLIDSFCRIRTPRRQKAESGARIEMIRAFNGGRMGARASSHRISC